MGNRAVIRTEAYTLGIYLHWNGGRDSVEAFLKYCEMKGYRPPDQDHYGWAYLCGVITNFFGDGMNVGIDKIDHMDTDNGDNGTYIIKGWLIIGREHLRGDEQQEHELEEMLLEIDSRQPLRMQLGKDRIAEYLSQNTEPLT